MSVIFRSLAVALLLSVLGLSWTAHAAKDDNRKKVKAIRSAEDLIKVNVTILKFVKPYQLATSAVYIHRKCAVELKLNESQTAFVSEQFRDISRKFIAAFDDTFVKIMKAPSTDALKQDYPRFLSDKQKPAVKRTDDTIKVNGCKAKAITDIVDYYEAVRKEEEKKKAAAAKVNNPAPLVTDILNNTPVPVNVQPLPDVKPPTLTPPAAAPAAANP